MTRTRRPALAAVAVLVLLGLGAAGIGFWIYADRSAAAAPTLPAGQTLEAAQLEELTPLPQFTLARAGAPLTAQALHGQWSFIFFGYTNCPDACPTTLGLLNHVQEVLAAQGVTPPRIVFVSVDPQRDTPELLQRYVAAFGAGAIGATGSEAALKGLLTYFGVSVERKEGGDRNSYSFDHTTNFFLVTPDGRWLATFPPAEEPDGVLEDTLKLLRMPLP